MSKSPLVLANAKWQSLEYFSLLRRLDYDEIVCLNDLPAVPFDEWWPEKKYLALRHDVDHSLVHAQKFAEAEYLMGIQSTYFVLPTLADFNPRLIERISRMGHEVGLHNNYLSRWIEGDFLKIDCQLDKDVAVFNEAMPRNILTGTAAHGDLVTRREGFVNYELWHECPPELRNNGHKWHKHPRYHLDDFGFDYEAYFLRRDAYLTDTGHRWQGQVWPNIGPFEKQPEPLSLEELIEAWNDMETGVLQLLVHPIWWEVVEVIA